MKTAKQIKMSLVYIGMTESELSEKLGTSQSAFSQRMKTDKFSKEELEKIASIIGAEYIAIFKFPDGTKI